jgi:hypothetical protein
MGNARYGRQRSEEKETGLSNYYIPGVSDLPLYMSLETPSDLCVSSLNEAFGCNAPIKLHVHPDQYEDALKTVKAFSEDFKLQYFRTLPVVVPDGTLRTHEWYLSSSVGSDPP